MSEDVTSANVRGRVVQSERRGPASGRNLGRRRETIKAQAWGSALEPLCGDLGESEHRLSTYSEVESDLGALLVIPSEEASLLARVESVGQGRARDQGEEAGKGGRQGQECCLHHGR